MIMRYNSLEMFLSQESAAWFWLFIGNHMSYKHTRIQGLGKTQIKEKMCCRYPWKFVSIEIQGLDKNKRTSTCYELCSLLTPCFICQLEELMQETTHHLPKLCCYCSQHYPLPSLPEVLLNFGFPCFRRPCIYGMW